MKYIVEYDGIVDDYDLTLEEAYDVIRYNYRHWLEDTEGDAELRSGGFDFELYKIYQEVEIDQKRVTG